MCRVLMYAGKPALLDDLLYRPDNSLIRQTTDAQLLNMLNIGGFGIAAWDAASHDPRTPFLYRSGHVSVFDRNLKSLARKLIVTGLIAHVRGVAYHERTTVGEQNAHPFQFEGCPLALAHNGELTDFNRMRYLLVPYITPAIAQQIRGNTDSEWIYALLASQFDWTSAPTMDVLSVCVERTLAILHDVRRTAGISTCSPVNLFISDGEDLLGVRYTFDFGCYDTQHEDPQPFGNAVHRYLSLWYTLGGDYGLHDGEWKMTGGLRNADSLMVASEPLTRDTSTWLEVPEYSLFHTVRDTGRLAVKVRYLGE